MINVDRSIVLKCCVVWSMRYYDVLWVDYLVWVCMKILINEIIIKGWYGYLRFFFGYKCYNLSFRLLFFLMF